MLRNHFRSVLLGLKESYKSYMQLMMSLQENIHFTFLNTYADGQCSDVKKKGIS